ncbi:carboxypeptidase-like regulatory domain-containing protein [Pedobacter boryungensis]|uniref:Carboxypeptidase-like regulatory domain-containing protein n=1 Tax=Pedobacter boryungensis TaxID=869962 RepID=A0ABX2DCU0_9SPHI|nr:carboxypeptidase-like regulatory domain-containing protein [Pedobacter boryungensis]NQX30806.1 carboxypeptidase-like regulatory domain-containing protein [Pedobacter boryungensis]
MRKIIFLLICFCSSKVVFAQKTISGQVSDNKGNSIPYVNIGIKASKTGALSDIKGNYTIQIADSLINDTLTFSSVGFEIKKIAIKNMSNKDFNVVLDERIIVLNEVKIRNKKRKTYKIGITGRTPMMFVPSTGHQRNDIFEQARLINVKEPVQVLNANIFVQSEIKEEVKVRINFYAVENGLPGKLLIEKNTIMKMENGKGWKTFDLTAEHIYLDQDFVIAFEMLPSTRKMTAFGAKIGAANSFIRSNSLGVWRKNAAAGCSIYVTVEN